MRERRVTTVFAALAVAAAAALSVSLRGATDQSGEWRAYGANNANLKYVPLDQINRDNVKDLRIAWRQSSVPSEVRKNRGAVDVPTNYQVTPLMVGGLLYASAGDGSVMALHPAHRRRRMELRARRHSEGGACGPRGSVGRRAHGTIGESRRGVLGRWRKRLANHRDLGAIVGRAECEDGRADRVVWRRWTHRSHEGIPRARRIVPMDIRAAGDEQPDRHRRHRERRRRTVPARRHPRLRRPNGASLLGRSRSIPEFGEFGQRHLAARLVRVLRRGRHLGISQRRR